jgi:PEGA domain
MAIEYLLVTYPEERAVLADGNRVGFTNHTFMLPTDEYLITLEGTGYAPPNQDVPLSGTSLVKPMVVSFSPIAAAGGGGGAPPFPPAVAPAAAPASGARSTGKKKKNA